MTQPNSLKEQCPKGHPYDEKNTRHYQGGRYCRACANLRERRRRIDRRSPFYSMVYERDNGVCRYCGAVATEVDHVVPVCNDGDKSHNVVLACRPCNTIKGSEGGFTLGRKNVLRWHGRLVAPGALYGEVLMEKVKEQRLRRQERQGLTHLVDYARKNTGGAS